MRYWGHLRVRLFCLRQWAQPEARDAAVWRTAKSNLHHANNLWMRAKDVVLKVARVSMETPSAQQSCTAVDNNSTGRADLFRVDTLCAFHHSDHQENHRSDCKLILVGCYPMPNLRPSLAR